MFVANFVLHTLQIHLDCNKFFFNYTRNIINYEGQIMSKTFLCKFMLCSEGIQFIFYSGVVCMYVIIGD